MVRDSSGFVVVAWALWIVVSYSVKVVKLMAINEWLKVAAELGLVVEMFECEASNIVREFNGNFTFSLLSFFMLNNFFIV